MNNTATVWRKTFTSDVYGTSTEAATARYTAMPCRIQAAKGMEMMRYAANRMEVTHTMFVPPEYSAISHEDEVVDAAGTRYRVTFVRDPDQMGHHIEVSMVQLKGDIQ